MYSDLKMGYRVTACFVIGVALAVASVHCNSEGDILNAWKTVLEDPNNVLQSWDPTLVNPCTWFHVTCNNLNSVLRLDLGNANLTGPLIPGLGNLTSLQYLELSENYINGNIPSEIGNLKRLISFGLSKNNLSGPLPSTFGSLTSLRFLRVSGNSLSGLIPSSLGNLRSLQDINLSGNKFTGDIPIEILALPRFGILNTLDVSDNMLAETVRGNSTVTTIIQDPKARR